MLQLKTEPVKASRETVPVSISNITFPATREDFKAKDGALTTGVHINPTKELHSNKKSATREGNTRQQIGSPRSLSHAIKKTTHSMAASVATQEHASGSIESIIPDIQGLRGVDVSHIDAEPASKPLNLTPLSSQPPLNKSEANFARYYTDGDSGDDNELMKGTDPDPQVQAMQQIMRTRIRDEMQRVRNRQAPGSIEERQALTQKAFVLSMNANKFARQAVIEARQKKQQQRSDRAKAHKINRELRARARAAEAARIAEVGAGSTMRLAGSNFRSAISLTSLQHFADWDSAPLIPSQSQAILTTPRELEIRARDTSPLRGEDMCSADMDSESEVLATSPDRMVPRRRKNRQDNVDEEHGLESDFNTGVSGGGSFLTVPNGMGDSEGSSDDVSHDSDDDMEEEARLMGRALEEIERVRTRLLQRAARGPMTANAPPVGATRITASTPTSPPSLHPQTVQTHSKLPSSSINTSDATEITGDASLPRSIEIARSNHSTKSPRLSPHQATGRSQFPIEPRTGKAAAVSSDVGKFLDDLYVTIPSPSSAPAANQRNFELPLPQTRSPQLGAGRRASYTGNSDTAKTSHNHRNFDLKADRLPQRAHTSDCSTEARGISQPALPAGSALSGNDSDSDDGMFLSRASISSSALFRDHPPLNSQVLSTGDRKNPYARSSTRTADKTVVAAAPSAAASIESPLLQGSQPQLEPISGTLKALVPSSDSPPPRRRRAHRNRSTAGSSISSNGEEVHSSLRMPAALRFQDAGMRRVEQMFRHQSPESFGIPLSPRLGDGLTQPLLSRSPDKLLRAVPEAATSELDRYADYLHRRVGDTIDATVTSLPSRPSTGQAPPPVQWPGSGLGHSSSTASGVALAASDSYGSLLSQTPGSALNRPWDALRDPSPDRRRLLSGLRSTLDRLQDSLSHSLTSTGKDLDVNQHTSPRKTTASGVWTSVISDDPDVASPNSKPKHTTAPASPPRQHRRQPTLTSPYFFTSPVREEGSSSDRSRGSFSRDRPTREVDTTAAPSLTVHETSRENGAVSAGTDALSEVISHIGSRRGQSTDSATKLSPTSKIKDKGRDTLAALELAAAAGDAVGRLMADMAKELRGQSRRGIGPI